MSINTKGGRRGLALFFLGIAMCLAPFFSAVLADETPAIQYKQIDDDTLQVEFNLPCAPDTLWVVLTDYPNSHKVMPNVRKTTVLSTSTEGEAQIAIVETKVGAGPFSMTYKSKMTAVRSHLLLLWEQTEGGFTKNSGNWQLSQAPNGGTNVVYTASLSHPLMPNWLKKSLIKDSIPELYESLKRNTQTTGE